MIANICSFEHMEAAINQFQPFKAPGPDGLYLVLLQKGWKLTERISPSRMAVRYGTFRICVLRTSHLEPYRTSVPYFSSIFEAYRTNVQYPYHFKKGVPYFLSKIEAYRTVLRYRTVLPSLLLTTHSFN